MVDREFLGLNRGLEYILVELDGYRRSSYRRPIPCGGGIPCFHFQHRVSSPEAVELGTCIFQKASNNLYLATYLVKAPSHRSELGS